jgi:hexulose-6-phosphate isomerase
VIKSINYWAFKDAREGELSPQDAISLAKKSGFKAIELVLDESKFINVNSKKEAVKKYLDYSKKEGIEISSLASELPLKYPLTSSDQQEIDKSKEIIIKMIEVAKWLDTDAVMVLPGVVENLLYPEKGIIDYDIAYKNCLKSLKDLKRFAEGMKVYLCIENIWNKFLLSPLEVRDFLDSVDSEYVGFYLDTGNLMLFGFPEQWIRILGKRIKRIHLKDFKKDIGTIEGFCGLLEGDVNFPEVMKALRGIKYGGYLTADIPFKEGLVESTSKAIDIIMKM